jgi:hypothetical protein
MVLGTNKHIPLLHLGHTKQPNRANIRSPSEMALWPKWQRDKWLFISLVDLSSDTSSALSRNSPQPQNSHIFKKQLDIVIASLRIQIYIAYYYYINSPK